MNDTCICDNAPKVWRLTGVTRTLRLRIFNPGGTPLDLTGRTVGVTIARDNSEFVYAPGFVIEGDDGNVVKFEWPADQQGAGDYTINVTTTDGSGNADRVNWHGPTGIRLVDFSFMVRGEDALGVTSEANIGLDGTFTMNGAGMSAYDEWLVEGHTGTPEDFIAWLRQPAEDAATEAEATVDAKMAEVDADMAAIEATAAADHTRAENDHTTATGDHTRAEADHVQAVTDSQQAATDHQQAESDAAAAAIDREKAAADRTKAADDRQQAAADHATAAQDHATAGSDHQQAQSDHSTASADHTQAVQDAERAASDHTRSGDDHDTAVADHQQAETDHTRAEQDHTTAAADHTTAAADHTQATADHAVMAGYDTRLGNVEDEVSQLGQKVWNFSFVGKGATFSTLHQLDGMRRYGRYRLYLPVTNWDLTGVSAGTSILQISSEGSYNEVVLSIYKEDTVLPYYDFTVPLSNDRIMIGGRAAEGVVVDCYVVDASYLDIARRSDVLGLDLSPWIYDRKITGSNGAISTYRGMCISSPVHLNAGDKISILSGGSSVHLVSKTDASGAFISALLSFPATTEPQVLRMAEYIMTEDAFVRICYSYGYAGSYYEINGVRADITRLRGELNSIQNGNVPIDCIENVGGVTGSGSLTSTNLYRYSSPIELKPGWTIAVESAGYNFAPISKTDSIGTTPFNPIVYVSSGDATTLHKYTHTNTSEIIEYIVCSWRFVDGQVPVYFEEGFATIANLSVNKIPELIGLVSTTYVSTARNYILKNEEVDGVDTLLYSKDCGKNWASTPNTIGDIVFVHWFADGTCLIAGNHAVYTTKDGLTFTQSTILDENGVSFTPSYNAFYRLGNYDSPYYEVDGKEVLIWNDYGISDGYVSRVWYSEDNGVTIRCICADNITRDINNVVINPRHFHRTFVDKNGVLWITSGDDGAECMLIRGTYSNGAWSFEILASGNEWKLGQFWIYGSYAYAVTDYTNGDRPTGIIRWPLSKIADSTCFEYVATIPNEPPLSSYFEDNAGVKIILPDGIGYKKFYMARNNYDFKQVNIEMADNVAPMVLIGPNYKGECIVNGIAGYNSTQPLRLNYRRYMLSDGLRNAGVSSFAVVPNLT